MRIAKHGYPASINTKDERELKMQLAQTHNIQSGIESLCRTARTSYSFNTAVTSQSSRSTFLIAKCISSSFYPYISRESEYLFLTSQFYCIQLK